MSQCRGPDLELELELELESDVEPQGGRLAGLTPLPAPQSTCCFPQAEFLGGKKFHSRL